MTADSLKSLLETGDVPPPVAFPMQALRYVPTASSSNPGNGAAASGLDPLADLNLKPRAFLGNFHSYPTGDEARPELDEDMAKRGVRYTWNSIRLDADRLGTWIRLEVFEGRARSMARMGRRASGRWSEFHHSLS